MVSSSLERTTDENEDLKPEGARGAGFEGHPAGQTQTVTVNYGVSDGTATTPASVSWTVTGTNDAPVITSSAQSGSVKEDETLSVSGAVKAALSA